MASRFSILLSFLLLTVVLVHPSTGQQLVEQDYFKPVPASFYQDISFDMPKVQVPEFPVR